MRSHELATYLLSCPDMEIGIAGGDDQSQPVADADPRTTPEGATVMVIEGENFYIDLLTGG